MDEITAIRGVTISRVLAIGLTQGGLPYVECEFSDASTGVICFPHVIAQALPLAFLEAASQLDVGASQAGKTVVAIPVDKAIIHIAHETAQTGALVLALTTKLGSLACTRFA